jgi:origin recognition complex subunit 4
MKHQTEIYDGEPLNFEMVYRRYFKFASQNLTMQNVERPIVFKAFEHLKVSRHQSNMARLTEAPDTPDTNA